MAAEYVEIGSQGSLEWDVGILCGQPSGGTQTVFWARAYRSYTETLDELKPSTVERYELALGERA